MGVSTGKLVKHLSVIHPFVPLDWTSKKPHPEGANRRLKQMKLPPDLRKKMLQPISL
jgi:hypothetical protein